MAASDVSALVDLATAPEAGAAPAEPVEEPILESPEPESAEPPESTGDQEPPEGAEPTEPPEKPVDGRTNPAAIRSALKAFREANPSHASAARELNNAYGRYTAYRSVFPKVADAQNAKALIDAIGGNEGVSSLQSQVKSIRETDALLYAGDARVLDNLIEDMKSEGKLDSFAKLASPYLERLQKLDRDAYFNVLKPHFVSSLVGVDFPGVVEALTQTLSGDKPNLDQARQILGQMAKWFQDLQASVDHDDKRRLDPDRQAFEKERSEFQSKRQQEFEKGVASSADSYNNKALGTALKPYLKLPFFKGWSRQSLEDLGNGLKQRLFSELGKDAGYQSQMDAFFAEPSPDQSRIVSYHSAKVDSMAKRIVKEVLETRYPGYAAKAAPKPNAAPKPAIPGAAPTPGVTKPTFVSAKPPHEQIDWNRTDDNLFITGRAFLKGGRFVTWNARYK